MMLCKIIQNTLSSHLSQNGLSVEQWQVLQQLWSADKLLWYGCSKAMASPAARCLKPACVRSCHHFTMVVKGKFSPEMDIFYFLLVCVKFRPWQPEVTLNPQTHITELSGQEWWQQRTVGLPCCMRYSSLPCPLSSPGNNSVHGSQLPLAFFVLLAPGLGMRQQVPSRVTAMCLLVTRLCHREGRMQWCGELWPSSEAACKDSAKADGSQACIQPYPCCVRGIP